jgi:CTP:molybdopterin cytidylyltransferase MocA
MPVAAIPVLVMLPPAGESPAEKWVAQGRQCAALDLIRRLGEVEHAGEIVACVAEEDDRAALDRLGVQTSISGGPDFHFGTSLWNLIASHRFDSIAYFGGASAPLMTPAELETGFALASESHRTAAIVNNYHSTDWAIVKDASLFEHIQDRLPTDNPIGWVLAHEAGASVTGLDPRACTRVDIDTPSDLVMCSRHPDLGPHLADFLSSMSEEYSSLLGRIFGVLGRDGSSFALIGRVPSHAWRALEGQTQIWIRVYSEERSMVASQRLAKGQVDSIISRLIESVGVEEFVDMLAGMVDGVLWDTRVWLATGRRWPSTADRFAADLGWVDDVADDRLRALTAAVWGSDLPIITGGHGVVSGGIYALIESRETED